jgi:hypothetical protein
VFSGESYKDYVRDQNELDVIFGRFFPEWTDTSYDRNVMPLAEIPSTTILIDGSKNGTRIPSVSVPGTP